MLVQVLTKPNSKVDKIEFKEGVLVVKIRARPIDGKANEYLIQVLSKFFSVPKSTIVLKKGHTSKIKLLEIPMDENDFHSIVVEL